MFKTSSDAKISPDWLLFDNLNNNLISSKLTTLDDLSTILTNHKDNLITGKLPYLKDDKISSNDLTKSTSNDYKNHIDFISQTLNLDHAKVTQLVNYFSFTVKNVSINNPESSYSPSNSNVLNYLITMIFNQQSLYFRILLKIVKNEFNQPMFNEYLELITSNGHNIIDNLIENIVHISKIYNSLKSPNSLNSSNNFDFSFIDVIKANLSSLLIDILNFFIHIILSSNLGFKISSVEKWISLMEQTDFLSSLNFNCSNEILSTIQSLATLVTLLFLDLEHNTGNIDDKDGSFLSNPTILANITNHILKTKANSIILYAWSIILHRQSIILDLLKDDPRAKQYQDSISNTVLKNLEIVSLSFAEEAAKLDVCQSLINCNDLISYDPIYPNILGIFVTAFVPYIEPTYPIIKTVSTIIKNSSNKIIETFFSNPSTEELLILLKAKLPLQLNSFLELISINSNLAVEELRSIPTYMVSVETSKFNKIYKINDQQPELVTLTDDFIIKLPFENDENDAALLMKKGSNAQILSTNKNHSLVLFLYEYNGWSLLGRIIKQLSNKVSTDELERNQTRNVIYQTLTKIFLELDKQVIDLIFNSLDSFIDEYHTVDLFVKTFNQALLLKDAELSSNCINLFNVLVKKGYTSIVWSVLYSSNLFYIEHNSGLAFDIIDRVETIQGSYSFTISVLELANTLLNNSLILKLDTDKNALKEKIINFFTNLLIQIFELFINWKYINEHEKFQIGNLITTFLNKICKFGTKFNSIIFKELSNIYQLSFHKIVAHFLIGVLDDPVSINPLFQCLNLLSDSTSTYSQYSKTGIFYEKWTISTIKFFSQLIKTRRIADISIPSSLEKKLYIDLPNIIKAYILSSNYKSEIFTLLTELVKGNWNDKPQSMLTHLRSTYSAILLNCLTENISNNKANYQLKISTFNLISAIMSSNQKGTSLFLITGKLISNEKTDISVSDVSLYNAMKLAVTETIDNQSGYTYHLLQAVSLSLKVWLGVCSDADNLTFVEKLIKIINNDSKEGTNKWRVGIITKSVEIISQYLVVSQDKSPKCQSKIFELLNSNKFIDQLKSEFKVQNYDSILFKEVESQLATMFGDFSLEKYQNDKNDLFSYTNYVFDDKLLNWIVDEKNVEVFNKLHSNLLKLDNQITFVHFQISLAKAYGGLITCFCNINSANINIYYTQLASKLLEINDDEGVLVEFGDQIYNMRMELSFLIIFTISKLSEKPNDDNITTILLSCLKLLSSREVNFYNHLTTINVGYYKPLLRILLISLPMIQSPKIISEHSNLLLDIFSDNICKPITVLFNNIRNQALSIPNFNENNASFLSKQVDDILLVLSLTQEFFKLKFSNEFYNNIGKILINSGAYRSISLMFTSSHLIKLNNEEVFIDYSMAFIYEFIQSKNISETLVNNGIFHLLMESPVSLIIQKTHVTPYSNNLTIIRLHKLWIKRIMPIILTIASHFGDKIIFYITQFALIFKNQFKDTLQFWLETDSLISTEIIEETEQIILLAKILNALDCYTYASTELGINVEDVKLVPGLDNIQERKIFVNALNYLLSHPKYLAMKVRIVDDNISIAQITNELNSMKESLLM